MARLLTLRECAKAGGNSGRAPAQSESRPRLYARWSPKRPGQGPQQQQPRASQAALAGQLDDAERPGLRPKPRQAGAAAVLLAVADQKVPSRHPFTIPLSEESILFHSPRSCRKICLPLAERT